MDQTYAALAARFALYVAFFPQLVAGPVERAPHLLPQFSRPFRLSIPMVKRGVFLILLGFIKKVIIAMDDRVWSTCFIRIWFGSRLQCGRGVDSINCMRRRMHPTQGACRPQSWRRRH